MFIRSRKIQMADADQSLTLAVLKEIRVEMNDMRDSNRKLQDLLLQSIDSNRRHFDAIQQQIKISAADLELMLKGELMGRLTHFETKIDHRIAELEERWSPRS